MNKQFQTARSDCNKHIIKREHYARKNNEWKPKKKFKTDDEAKLYIKNIRCINTYLIYVKYVENGILELKRQIINI